MPPQAHPTAKLTQLPPEILAQILSYAPTARTLRDLALTCRTLHASVEAAGWKSFVLNQFPSIPVPPYWKDAAHALTTQSRNWDRRAFLAREVEPHDTRIHVLPQGGAVELRGRWKRPHGQTMGYQPVVDSYEEWTGGGWDARKEVVAWGAGAKLMVKSLRRGKEVAQEWQRTSKEGQQMEFDAGRNRVEWLSYHDAKQREGRDDITTVNILHPHQRAGPDGAQEIVVGRASGELKLLSLARDVRDCTIRTFETGGALVRSADVTLGSAPLLAACLGDARAVLYSVHGEGEKVAPISEVNCVSREELRCRTWSSRFLSPSHLAVGRGVSKQIIHVYNVSPSGLDPTPTRIFGTGHDSQAQTSAYPILPLPPSSTSSAGAGDLFISGSYDGQIRMHDLRCQADYTALLTDPTEDSPIFSLATVGRERILAGASANGLLKVFDLRMPGGRVYHYLDPSPLVSDPQVTYTGWNLFTTPADTTPKWTRHRPPTTGPIYTLSRPSPSSPSLYIGRENSVVHLNITAALDRHPDPVFKHAVVRTRAGGIDAGRSWDGLRVLRLSMYEQTVQGNFGLKVQRDVGRLEGRVGGGGWDERWCDVVGRGGGRVE